MIFDGYRFWVVFWQYSSLFVGHSREPMIEHWLEHAQSSGAEPHKASPTEAIKTKLINSFTHLCLPRARTTGCRTGATSPTRQLIQESPRVEELNVRPPPQKPVNDDSPVNTNKRYGFTHGFLGGAGFFVHPPWDG